MRGVRWWYRRAERSEPPPDPRGNVAIGTLATFDAVQAVTRLQQEGMPAMFVDPTAVGAGPERQERVTVLVNHRDGGRATNFVVAMGLDLRDSPENLG